MALVVFGACRPAPKPQPQLELSWTGSRSGRLSAPALAHWCPQSRTLAVIAIAGDTSAGIAVFSAADSVEGAVPVLDAARTDSVRPRATVALRWMDSTTVAAFESSFGHLTLTRDAAGRLSGRLDATLRATPGGASLAVTGRLHDVPVTRAGCNF